MSEDGVTAHITLSGGGDAPIYAVIDAEDIALAAPWHWHLDDHGYARRSRDVRRGVGQSRLHRVILGLTKDERVKGKRIEVDHIDRDPLNNRRSNLRIITHAANLQNTVSRRGASSPHRGVYWYKAGQKWGAVIQVSGRRAFLGYFTDEREAAEVARAARARLMPYANN